MSQIQISIEALSDELISAYEISGLERSRAGRHSIEWAFAGNPYPFSVARQEGEIIGLSGYIRNRMQFGDASGSAVQAVDSFVSESMRGQGIFTRLACAYDEHSRHSGTDLVWGFPNDSAAPVWFDKLGWSNSGQVPFMVKPLRTGFFSRKLGLPLDLRLTLARDQNIDSITDVDDWADALWAQSSPKIGVSVIRDRNFLRHRLFDCPQAHEYRVVAETDTYAPAIVATREKIKHGGKIAYIMEALGDSALQPLLMSELGRMASRGVEIALAWSFPWSPNYRALRKAGFVHLPERLRPIRIWFGSAPKTAAAERAKHTHQWYLSYLDSDTV